MQNESAIQDIIVVGGGTAGLTAAIYGQRAGRQMLVLEAGVYGGQIVNASEIANYPGIPKLAGYQFAMNLQEQVTSLGARLEHGRVKRIQAVGSSWLAETETGSYLGKAVILATGARHRKLGIEGEQALTGKGVSYCAACDGAFYRGRTVAVIGGGNTALGDAEYLANLCETVYLIHRRQEIRGDAKTAEQLKKRKNVRMLLDTEVVGFVGREQLEALIVTDTKTGTKQKLNVAGAFIAVGQEPDNQEFEAWVTLDEKGYIRAGEDCKTQTAGIFAAGDCRTKQVRQLTTAAADGAVAATVAIEYLEKMEKTS